MSKWKVVGKKRVFKAPLFEVYSSKIKFESGKEEEYLDVYRKPTVIIFPLTPKNEIYLISQKRYLHARFILEAPAGYIDENESSLSAAKRELKEETGLVASHWEQIAKVESSANVIKATANLFLATDLEEDDATPEELENIEVFKIPIKTAVEKIFTGEIFTGSTIQGILMIDKLIRDRKL
ncbi:MAG: NUDIX hydrolase [Candidatus Levybacteria bacterium]|nr:NUDIX hydrolase [Candidatus Levybacteria bacterium]